MNSLTGLDSLSDDAMLSAPSSGYRHFHDPLFAVNNRKIFQPFVRLGVYSFDDENLWHNSNFVRCNIPNCNQQFDTVFAYESHYNSLHRFLCGQCSKHLPSAHLLDLHLSETHDSFFAVQSEKKPMYACYLEECLHKSQTPAERHDHCITKHKFPHDFRFDGFNHKKAMISSIKASNSHNNNNNNSHKHTDKKPSNSSIVQASKFVTNQVHDEDIVLEDKSILLTAQRKPITSFSFGHRKMKTFNNVAATNNSAGDDKSYAKALTKKSKQPKKSPSASTSTLECEKMMEDLIDSLPQ